MILDTVQAQYRDALSNPSTMILDTVQAQYRDRNIADEIAPHHCRKAMRDKIVEKFNATSETHALRYRNYLEQRGY